LLYKKHIPLGLVILCFGCINKLQAQHSFGVSIKSGTLLTFNPSVSRNLLGFEKNANAYYRFEPSSSVFGIHAAAGFTVKRYAFPFESSEAILRQNMVSISLMAMLKLKHNGARLMVGFNTGLLTYAHTEIHSTLTNYYYGDDYLNSLQHSNKTQVDVCVEIDQPIGVKQKFSVGLNISQNVNKIIKADFIYPYHDNRNALTYLTVNKNLMPTAVTVVLKYKIK
jgi:Outer membrane protein beta-barrel domain